MEYIKITTDYIKLDQLLKWSNLVSCGSTAKHVISERMVKVNDEIEARRGRKIYEGYIVEFNAEQITVIK